MKIHLVETTPNDVDNFSTVGGTNFLISYFYDKNHKLTEKTLEAVPNAKILLDSGAFSAYNTKKELDFDKYMEYVTEYKDDYIAYFNMDVVYDGEKSKINYDIMRKKGFNPIPVFHYGSDFSYLKHYIQHADYIALSGFAQHTMQQRLMINWTTKCLEMIPKQKKIHLLGVTSPTILYRFGKDITSVDSSSVTRHRSYTGTISYSGILTRANGIPTKISNNQVNQLQQYSTSRMIQMEKEINEQLTEKTIG